MEVEEFGSGVEALLLPPPPHTHRLDPQYFTIKYSTNMYLKRNLARHCVQTIVLVDVSISHLTAVSKTYLVPFVCTLNPIHQMVHHCNKENAMKYTHNDRVRSWSGSGYQ